MRYFDGIKIGDRVWDFRYGWGIVKYINTEEYPIVVYFPSLGYHKAYNFDGKTNKYLNQTLFWDEIKFEIPKSPKIKLKECNYLLNPIDYNNLVSLSDKINLCGYDFAIKNGFTRNDRKTAEKALKTIKRFTRLLALRDQECPNSRGYEFELGKLSYGISLFKEDEVEKWGVVEFQWLYNPDKVYFRTREDAQKICDILNSGRFDLEGE